jgi:hypothetical protein
MFLKVSISCLQWNKLCFGASLLLSTSVGKHQRLNKLKLIVVLLEVVNMDKR